MSDDLRHRLGAAGEEAAAQHMLRLGFDVIARNHRTRWGELDLIAFDGETIVFVEVKTRRAGSGAPFDKLGPSKQRQVRRMAGEWLSATLDRPFGAELRFDAIGVVMDARGRLAGLDHLEGAF